MTPTSEQLAAYADDQLEGVERARVAAAVAADPILAEQVAAHRALKVRLGKHFAPIAQQPVPDHLAALLASQQDKVVNLADVRVRRKGPPRWAWLAGSALAASLVLALSLRPPGNTGYVEGEVAAALDHQLVAQQSPDAPIRVLLSFRDASGAYCRAFESGAEAAIACRDPQGWKLRANAPAENKGARSSEYRQAGSAGQILATAQSMAVGSALGAQEEVAARQSAWGANRTD